MRHLPTPGQYCGLTIVLSNPSRYDKKELISEWAGVRFNQEALAPTHTTREQCDIRLSSSLCEGLLPETRAILLLGDKAFKEWTTVGQYNDYSLGEQRGYPLQNPFGLPCIASYLPQDAVDQQDYETRLNPILNGEGTTGDDTDDAGTQSSPDAISDSDAESDDEGDVKRHGRTSRNNYFFWLQRDVSKIMAATRTPTGPSSYEAILAPSVEEVAAYLGRASNTMLYLDIECHPDTRDTFCIGVNVEDSNEVLVIPLLRYDYTLAYSSIYRILRPLAKAMRNNTVVCHNAMFDLAVLASKYSLPFGRAVYDTMLANHRCFPEAEKSLGHCMSCWPSIWEPFHKDQGVFPPWTPQQERALWSYNAKDVWAMKLIRRAQLDYASTRPGLLASIGQSCTMIRPYVISSLQGIRYDESMRAAKVKENDRLMTHYLRALRMLAGGELLPTSPKQCTTYFYDRLGYSVQGRTKTGGRSTGDKAIQKLKLKYPMNSAIDFILAYRERAKEAGMCRFKPWKPLPADNFTI